MGVGFPNVTFLSLRKVHKSLLHLRSQTKQVCFCKVQMLFTSETCEVMALESESDRNHLLYDSIKDITDETLIAEIRNREYNLARQHDQETTAEIVKIS